MTKKKISVIIVILLIIVTSISLVLTYMNHTINPKLIKEYALKQEICDIYGEEGYCYFFVQDDKHYCFNGNGVEEMKKYVPQFDTLTLDIRNYNYIVAINCEVNSLNYSYKTAYKTMSFGIDTYISDADLKKTHDNTVRIYEMKKINIDYDFKKYGPPGTDFNIANNQK